MTYSLNAKLTFPLIAHTIRRDRLIERLESPNTHIKWVQAPPGYGKTTLLSDFFTASKSLNFWYQISSESLDPRGFFEYLSYAVKDTSAQEKLIGLLRDSQIADLELFARQFASTMYKNISEPFNLVFDDFHLIPDKHEINSLFLALLENLPAHGRIFFASRLGIPPYFSRMYVNRQIELITSQDLIFRETEAKELLESLNVTDSEDISRIQISSKGWATGMVIMGDACANNKLNEQAFCNWEHDLLDSYFSAEITRNITTTKLKLLSKVSVFPFFTLEMGSKLCSVSLDEFSELIDSLYRKNYFVESRGNTTKNFRFHPLFRDYLNNRLLDKNEFKDDNFILLASQLMSTDGQLVEAANLLTLTQHWHALADLCINNANYLLSTGRHNTLTRWIEPIPSTVLQERNWLQYWKAKALLPFHPLESRSQLHELLNLFIVVDDIKGQYLTCAAAAESYIYDADEYLSSAFWVHHLERLQLLIENNVDIEDESIVIEALLALMQWEPSSQIDHDKLHERAIEVLFRLKKSSLGIRLASSIVRFSIVNADHSRIHLVLNKLREYAQSAKISPVEKVVLHYAICIGSSMACDMRSEDGEHLFSAMDDARALDMKIMQFQAQIICIQGGLLYGNRARAEEQLQILEHEISPIKTLDKAYYYYISGWLQLRKGNISRARSELIKSLSYSQQVATLGQVYALFPLITLEIEENNFDIARKHLSALEKLSDSTNMRMPTIKLLLSQVYLSLTDKNLDLDMTALRRVFALCREFSVFDFMGLIPRVISSLYQAALENDIEVDHVTKMIQFQCLPPTSASQLCLKWPWPVRIYLMGDICFMKYGESVTPTKKSASKVISLLKLLVLQNGQPILVTSVMDTLWNNKDNAKADNSFKTTILRLRKLIGREAVIVDNGYVLLNRKKVWVDAWAIEHSLKTQELSLEEEFKRNKVLVELYKGNLVVESDVEYWLTPYGAKLNQKYTEHLEHFGLELIELKNYGDAYSISEELFRINELSDTAYYIKIKLLLSQNENAIAISTYRTYQQQLYKRLSARPSQKIEDLINSVILN